MKYQHVNCSINCIKAFVSTVFFTVIFFLSTSVPANAQIPAIRFTMQQVRVTVPINSTNSTVLTNVIDLVDHATNADFSLSGVPSGVGISLTDTNFNTLTSTVQDTNLLITVNTTNLPEGIYTFSLNAAGFDTNGSPVNTTIPIVIQAAHIWNGSIDVSNAWSSSSSWLGGVPTTTSDVVFTDIGAQTNNPANDQAFTNSYVDASMTIASLRFAQLGTRLPDTNFPGGSVNHHVHLLPNVTLTVTNGFSVLRDFLESGNANAAAPINVYISGETGSKLVVSNQFADASVSVIAGAAGTTLSTLVMSNLNNMAVYATRLGFMDYSLYPNYRALNNAFNAGRGTNDYSGRPRFLTANIYLPKTNFFKATYIDPQNYTNVMDRNYAFMLMNNEQSGISSGTPQNFWLGLSNSFLVDAVCFYGANANGTTRFATSNSVAKFRNTDGISRLSNFTISDDAGTNEAGSNMKGNLDFSLGTVDIFADKLYISRDRILIATNNTPNIQGTLTIGKGVVDVNSAVLGYQEHTKPDWTVLGGGQPYLNYCRGSVLVTNSGLFRINGTMTLGYTADTNSVINAQQYNTWGQLEVGSNSVIAVSNIVVDGNLNFYDGTPRNNNITIGSFGSLIVSNSIGADNFSVTPTTGLPGLPLDNLTISSSGVLTLFVTLGKTNVYVRTLTSIGATPGIVKIASLPTIPVFPTNIALIKYASATPVLAADMTAIPAVSGQPVQGYIINNPSQNTIDLFVTTNAPRTLVWTGSANNNWDLSSLNWVPQGGGSPTKYSMGDIAIFDDSSTVTNINITEVVVPNQSTTGVIITNNIRAYVFNDVGGQVAGTARILKQGTNALYFNAPEAGPIVVASGSVNVGSGGILGQASFLSNTVLNVLNGGTVNGVTATNAPVTVFNGGTISGAMVLNGTSLYNDGTINIPGAAALNTSNGSTITNTMNAVINLGTANPALNVNVGCSLANDGTITTAGGRLTVDGRYYGSGLFFDGVNPPTASAFGRYQMNNTVAAVTEIGDAPGMITNVFSGVRLDLSGNNAQNTSGKLIIDLDLVNNVYDQITSVRWNNIGCVWVMNKLSGSFASGQNFRVLVNANGTGIENLVDTYGIYPLIQPTVPGPGLQWNLRDIQKFGIVAVTNSTMIWDGAGNGSWDTNGSPSNWKTTPFGDNQGAIFDDTATGSTTVTLTTPVAPAGIAFTPTNTLIFTNITFITNMDMTVTTNTIFNTNFIFQVSNTPSFMPGIVVSNAVKDYTFVANTPTNRITGMTSLYKTGSGTLTLLTSNDFTGGMIIEGGTVAITNASAVGTTPVNGKSAYDQIMINNGTLKYFGPGTNQALGRPITLNADGGTFEVSSSVMEFGLNSPINGDGALTKTGPGVVFLSSQSSLYKGGTIVNQGTVRMNNGNQAGFGAVDLNNSSTLQWTNGFTFTNAVNINGSGTTILLQGNSTNIVTGPWSGSGNVTLLSTNAGKLHIFDNDITGLSGTVSFGASVGSFRFNNRTNQTPCNGSASATFDLGSGSATLYNVNRTNLTYNLGALAGGANTKLMGSATNTSAATTYSIGANNSSTVFNGVIANGVGDTVAIVKVGSGGLLLNGINTYTGPTTVSAGTLGGSGSIASALTVTSSGTLSPGSPIGTFTVSNTAALAGNVMLEINRSDAATNDMVNVTGTITASGTLFVTNVGPTLVNGTTFRLFNKAVTGFSSVTLDSRYTWNNNIGVDGTVQVTSGIPSIPTNISVSVSGNTLTLSWPTNYVGWGLQNQTNTLAVGLQTNDNAWFDIVGAETTNLINVSINPTNGSVFYRMILH